MDMTPALKTLLLGGALLSACVTPVYQSSRPGYVLTDIDGDGDLEEVAVSQAPPPPLVEVVPVAPGPGYLWVGGRWGWVGTRWVWRPGRHVVVRPGYQFRPGHWQARPHGWVYVRPHWHR
jgi:hypothetical protein